MHIQGIYTSEGRTATEEINKEKKKKEKKKSKDERSCGDGHEASGICGGASHARYCNGVLRLRT